MRCGACPHFTSSSSLVARGHSPEAWKCVCLSLREVLNLAGECYLTKGKMRLLLRLRFEIKTRFFIKKMTAQGPQPRRAREPKPRRDTGFLSSSSPMWADAGPHQHTCWLGWRTLLPQPLLPHAAQGIGENASAKPGILDRTTNVLFQHYTVTESQY